MRNGFVAVVTVPDNVVATVMDYAIPEGVWPGEENA